MVKNEVMLNLTGLLEKTCVRESNHDVLTTTDTVPSNGVRLMCGVRLMVNKTNHFNTKCVLKTPSTVVYISFHVYLTETHMGHSVSNHPKKRDNETPPLPILLKFGVWDYQAWRVGD